ncbi:MAG TPA: DHH family phosphoesterase [Candidatus Blautia intestinigallinarum]|nr:DHH family phosphoesterase [Candidatus Cottocaccamicrobium excrementipullorum]HIV35132.1 DHH family phosphoesterase [Candidatus Blautia intestinigallinarum]
MKKEFKLRGQLKKFMRWPVFLSVLLIGMDIGVYFLNVKAGVLVTVIVVLYIAIAAALYFYNKPIILNELIDFANQYDQLEQRMLENLAVPYGLVNSEGKLLWGNRNLMEMLGKDKVKKRVSYLFPEITEDNLPQGKKRAEIEIAYEERIYNAVMHQISLEELVNKTGFLEAVGEKPFIYAMYLFDVTELSTYKKKSEEDKLVIAEAYLDNYDEALESVEEVRRALLIALIDRKITKYFSNYGGLVRKLEKDKYFLIMQMSSLRKLQEERFHILDEVKTVNIGNEMSLTLSIGIGVNGATYGQSYEYSRVAMEMALGRGGDQVVIKNGNNITYFGGKSQQMEKATRVKARVKAQALSEIISTKERVVVMGHKITDVDAFGAAVGIYRAAKTLGRPAHIVVNDPTTSIRPLMAGYLENQDYEPDMFVTSQQAKEMVDQSTVVVVVDTNKPSYTECEDLLYMTKTIVVLDHHRRGSEVIQNAVLSYVEPYASSACEMVAEILQYMSDGIRIRSLEADSMYAGIIIDTNNFLSKAGVRTFEAAAFLRRCGADVTRVRKMLRDDLDSYKARAAAIRDAEIYRNDFIMGVCPSKGLKSPTVVGAQAANELLDVEGIKASFVLTSYHNVIYISARSIDEVNVQVIMEKLGGGGHLNVAGAQVSGYTMTETLNMIKNIINEMKEQGDL